MTEIVFITSSREKLANVRHISRNYDVFISKQKNYGIGYEEPREANRHKLLHQSFRDALKRWEKSVSNPHKFFFIEDTSVIIESLSSEDNEYPGTDIKYWMKQNSFSDIDLMLRKKGNNRTTIVRSDVLLYLPKALKKKFDKEYLIFTSKISGNITDSEFEVNTRPFYSWLNEKSFNKWFVPNECNVPMSLLPIEVIDKYDFRRKAITDMLSFLETEKVIKKKRDLNETENLSLFPKTRPLIIVCGPTCAGKTTLAEYLRKKYNFYHIEASDFMYQNYHEIHGVGSGVRISDFAEKALIENPCIVSDQIVSFISNLKKCPVIITGFRSFKEIECLKKKLKGDHDIDEYYIEADEQLRYERNKIRKRLEENLTYDEFIRIDNQQMRMGLSEIKSKLINDIIINDNTFENFYLKFEQKHYINPKEIINEYEVSKQSQDLKLEDLIISVLSEFFSENKFFTTAKISKIINTKFPKYPKNKNNVSRYFNQYFYPYYEIKLVNGKRHYKLSQTGMSRSYFIKKVNKVN